MARYSIRIVEGAKAEIRRLKAGHRKIVLDAIRRNLLDRPGVEEGGKKVLRGLKPPWTQVTPVWQLAAVPFRIFYDVDDAAKEVTINAVREKPPGTTTEEIL